MAARKLIRARFARMAMKKYRLAAAVAVVIPDPGVIGAGSPVIAPGRNIRKGTQ